MNEKTNSNWTTEEDKLATDLRISCNEARKLLRPKLEIKYSYYVLHSPYPDKTWRGIEKCVSTGASGTPLLFDSKSDAQAYAERLSLQEFIPVEIELSTPGVRKPLMEKSK